MKIQNIKIQNFQGLNCDIPITKDINVFVGPNGARKSSIFDALLYSWTGKVVHRGAKTIKDARDILKENLNEPLKVEVKLDDCLLQRGDKIPTRVPVLPYITKKLPAEVLLEARRIISMTDKERQELFLPLISCDDSKAKIKEFLDNHSIPSQWQSPILSDLDAAQGMVVSNRRSLKQRLKMDLDEPIQPSISVMYDRKSYPLKGIDKPKFLEIQKQLSLKEQKTIVLQKRQEFLNGIDIKASKETCEELRTEIRRKEIAIDNDNEYLEQVKEHAGKAQGKLELLKASQNTDGKDDCCPLCNSKVSQEVITKALGTEDELNVMIEKFRILYKDSSLTLKDAVSKLASNNQELDQIEANVKQAETIEPLLAKDYDFLGIKEESELPDLLINLTNNRRAVVEVLQAINQYEVDLAEVAKFMEDKAKVESDIELMNDLDSWLKPDGILRELGISKESKLDILPCFEFNNQLEIASDGSIRFRNRTIQQASTSEQYRVGLALNECICRFYGFPFFFADGVEMISDKGFIKKFIQELEFEQVFLNSIEYNEYYANDSVKVFNVQEGMVG